jgi:hypothetical protein
MINIRVRDAEVLDVNVMGKKRGDGGNRSISGDAEIEKGWDADLTQKLSPKAR